jgi:hypothetical protein
MAVHNYAHDYIRMEINVLYLKISQGPIVDLIDNCIVFENVMASIGDLMVTN